MAPALALIAAVVLAADPPDAERTFAFAESLLAEGDHYRAIGEYKRYLFLAPEGEQVPTARFAIGLAYLRGGQSEAAAQHFQQSARLLPDPLRADALLQSAYARYVGGAYTFAAGELTDWLEREGEAPRAMRDRAHYLLGWSQLSLGRDAQALASFATIATLPRQTELLEAVRRLERVPTKSPLIAGLLSVVPGAGHVYVGQPFIGLTAFLWNGLFGYALYDSIRQGQVGTAIVLGLFELLWYSGSVFGAVQGAMKYNRDVRTNALEDLRRDFDDRPESWPPAPSRPG